MREFGNRQENDNDDVPDDGADVPAGVDEHVPVDVGSDGGFLGNLKTDTVAREPVRN